MVQEARVSAQERPLEGGLAAGGTLPRTPEEWAPSGLRRLRLLVELCLLFVGAPLAMSYAIHGYRIPLVLVLQPVLLGLVAYLLLDPRFRLRTELSKGFALSHLLAMLALAAAVTVAVVMVMRELHPDQFLGIIRNRPGLWLLIICFYPLLSVIPQELVYRTFFFHRYGPLFGSHRWAAILTNGALFGLGHVMFGNWIAILGTFAAGILIAYRYEKTRSFWAAWLEHTLYGWLVFTVGLGQFFFTGVSNFR